MPGVEQGHDDCGCCARPSGPGVHENPPGRATIAYRIGTHSSFLGGMTAQLPLEAIHDGPHADQRPLARLTTRDADDPSIALLNAWATAADVLAFYQERIANEGFLATAKERRSVLEMARAIGYELSGGVAAQTLVAFALETAKGAPGVVQIKERTRIQSVPEPGKLPQTFETIESIEARPEWNAMPVQFVEPQDIVPDQEDLYLRGTATGLQPGDFVLLVGDERLAVTTSNQWDVRKLLVVEADNKRDWTHIVWDRGLGSHPPTSFPTSVHPRLFALRIRGSFFGYNAPDWKGLPDTVKQAYETDPGGEWPHFAISVTEVPPMIELDQPYPRILPGGWLALKTPESGLEPERELYVELYRVLSASTAAQSGFGVTTKTTRVTLDTDVNLDKFANGRRDTLVLAGSEEIAIAEAPIWSPFGGKVIPLAGLFAPLPRGRTVLVTGRLFRAIVSPTAPPLTLQDDEGDTASVAPGDALFVLSAAEPVGTDQLRWHLRDANGFEGELTANTDQVHLIPADEQDPTVSEAAVVDSVTSDTRRTTLHLADALRNAYDPATVLLLANAALATNGETVEEVLGSGDASLAGQRFALHKPPLTFVSSSKARGSESTLELRVSGVLWEGVPSLFEAGPKDQVHMVHIDDSGEPRVIFGDGVRGARPPSGTNNVKARYRSGIGPDGEVPAGTLTMLQSRPPGVKACSNPLPATGSAAPERLEDARRNAPRTVLTLDRVVSLQDHEDFARTFAGVGKARATELWDGETRIVHLTVAPDGGRADGLDANRIDDFRVAMEEARDPGGDLRIAGFERILFRVSLGVRVEPRFDSESVYAEIRKAFVDTFGFAEREFGQHVTAAEVVAVAQAVPGVEAIDLSKLYKVNDPAGPTQTAPPALLQALPARLEDGVLETGQLLLLDPTPAGVEVHEMVVSA